MEVSVKEIERAYNKIIVLGKKVYIFVPWRIHMIHPVYRDVVIQASSANCSDAEASKTVSEKICWIFERISDDLYPHVGGNHVVECSSGGIATNVLLFLLIFAVCQSLQIIFCTAQF